MNKEELLVVAKELRIENPESLAYNDLKKAVSQAKKADTIVEEKKEEIVPVSDATESNDSIDPIIDIAIKTSNTEEEEEEDLGMIKDYYEDNSGRKYKFSVYAPEKFRFNNQVKTQEEWLQDDDAMEQLVFGNCSYVEPIFSK